MNLKKAMATAMFLEKKKEETVEFLASNIAGSFSLLANIEPGLALQVLDQLNEQFNEEVAVQLAESNKERIEEVASEMHFTSDDLEN